MLHNKMTRANGAADKGFLNRLRNDASGNVIAIMAASMVPVVGLIGAGVDFSREYLVRTRLQQACDAGALAARKQMGDGVWTANNNKANAVGVQMFNANFEPGTAGSTDLTKEYHPSQTSATATGSAILGSAAATVPLTLLRLFGDNEDRISVTCRADTGKQNTDIMMVLDVTGSMNETAGSETKIVGLRKAAGCFYETLTTQNSSLCPNAAPAPITSNSRIRIGFMPYNINVNVGKLLPTNMVADTWTYQSREWGSASVVEEVVNEETTVQQDVTTGGTFNRGSGAPWSLPASLTNAVAVWHTSDSSKTDVEYDETGNVNDDHTDVHFIAPAAPSAGSFTGSFSTTSNSVGSYQPDKNAYSNATRDATTGAAACNSLITTPDYTTIVMRRSDDPSDLQRSEPVQGGAANQAVYTYSSTQNFRATRIRYVFNYWHQNDNGWHAHCDLQKIDGATTPSTATWKRSTTGSWSGGTTTTQTVSSTVGTPTLTTVAGTYAGWTYKPVPTDVSDLKSGSTWNSSLVLPLGALGANRTVGWDGCIHEAQTFKNVDGTVSDDWGGIPASAKDMDINLIPNPADATTLWGPALKDAVWARYNFIQSTTTNITTSTVSRTFRENNRSMAEIKTTADLSPNYDYACPTEAKKLQEWPTPTAFDSYLNGLTPSGNTYHDIGLAWGGRFLSDAGVFGAENQTATNGKPIERHMIFMSDGDTVPNIYNNGPQGLNWWDRKQTTAEPTNAILTDLINARTSALCTRIKNQNIVLWVIAYGSGINTTSKARLRLCATSTSHYFDAASTTNLNTAFGQIAGKISGLRLTD